MILSTTEARRQAGDLLNSTFRGMLPFPVPLVDICLRFGIRLWRRPMQQFDALAIKDRDDNYGILVNSRRSTSTLSASAQWNTRQTPLPQNW